MNNWSYLDKEITELSQLPEGAYGFIYKIQNIMNGKFYIGKKNLHSERNIKLGKKALAARTDKRASKKKKVIKESDWKIYHGSEEDLQKDIETYGHDSICRTILHICYSKTALTYQEVKWQMITECLETELSYNKNILGKFYKNLAIS
jgi:hypothetical protein